MFLRFIRLLMIIFFVFTVVTWPVLLPVDAADITGSDREGLDKLSWGK
jgi:calcium permeable stress-gated cation channel